MSKDYHPKLEFYHFINILYMKKQMLLLFLVMFTMTRGFCSDYDVGWATEKVEQPVSIELECESSDFVISTIPVLSAIESDYLLADIYPIEVGRLDLDTDMYVESRIKLQEDLAKPRIDYPSWYGLAFSEYLNSDSTGSTYTRTFSGYHSWYGLSQSNNYSFTSTTQEINSNRIRFPC